MASQKRRQSEDLVWDGSILATGFDIQSRTLYILGSIDNDTLKQFLPCFRFIDQTLGKIHIILASQGGDEFVGHAIYDCIKLARNQVTVDVYGAAMSIAAMILQAATTRRLGPQARMMVHNGTLTSNEHSINSDTFISLGEEARKNNQRYHEILAARSEHPVELITSMCVRETYFSAEEAIQFGLADELIPPSKKSKAPKEDLEIQILPPRAKKHQ